MTTIYQDESGDFGYDFTKARTYKNFFITFLITNDKRPIERAVKKTYASLVKARKKRSGGLLHAYYEDESTKFKLLNQLSQLDIRIAIMRYDKTKVVIAEEPRHIYAGMVVTLINRLYQDGILDKDEPTFLTAAQLHTKKKYNVEFEDLVRHKTKEINFDMDISTPDKEKCLQAADFISWANARKYELADDRFINTVSSKIVKEYEYY
jgi:hypothetical protein